MGTLEVLFIIIIIIYKVAKVVHENWSDKHCNQSDTLLPIDTTTTRALVANVLFLFPRLEHTHTVSLCVLCLLI